MTFHIAPGTRFALVGNNGAGHWTLVPSSCCQLLPKTSNNLKAWNCGNLWLFFCASFWTSQLANNSLHQRPIPIFVAQVRRLWSSCSRDYTSPIRAGFYWMESRQHRLTVWMRKFQQTTSMKKNHTFNSPNCINKCLYHLISKSMLQTNSSHQNWRSCKNLLMFFMFFQQTEGAIWKNGTHRPWSPVAAPSFKTLCATSWRWGRTLECPGTVKTLWVNWDVLPRLLCKKKCKNKQKIWYVLVGEVRHVSQQKSVDVSSAV